MSSIYILFKYILFLCITLCIFIIGFYTILGLFTTPSNARNWADDQAILPYAEIDNDLIHVKNVRNFAYKTTDEYTPNYYDKTYTLSSLKKVYYIVEPFSGFKGSAHTFLSFEFENGSNTENKQSDFLVVSVEIRKEKGESFSVLKGLLNQYEIMYVLADENDAIKLRSNYRNDQVFVYPIKSTPEKIQAIFTDILNRVNVLKDKPEFYNTVYNTCTTNIMDHVNSISPSKIPFTYKVLLPAYSDELAFDLHMIDTDLSLDDARKKYNINERATLYRDDSEFSLKIRQ
jgi:hypothetical protein